PVFMRGQRRWRASSGTHATRTKRGVNLALAGDVDRITAEAACHFGMVVADPPHVPDWAARLGPAAAVKAIPLGLCGTMIQAGRSSGGGPVLGRRSFGFFEICQAVQA